MNRTFSTLCRGWLTQHIIIVHHLPKSNTLSKKVAVNMQQNVKAIELIGRHTDTSHSVGQFRSVSKLLISH